MKYVKMLGLAAVAAMALMAFFGASSASATVLCKNSSDPCTSDYEPEDVIIGTAINATLTSSLTNVICTHSEVELRVTDTGGAGKPVHGTVDNLDFTECKTPSSGTHNCTVEVLNLPFTASATVTETGPNGTLKVSEDNGGGAPEAHVVCPFINCTFGNTVFELPITGGNPAHVTANAVKLNRISGFFCPSSATWDATYSAPNVWVRPS